MHHLGEPQRCLLGFPGSHSSWKPEREWTLMANSPCTKKKDSTEASCPAPALSGSTATAPCSLDAGCRRASTWAIPQAGSLHLCSCFRLPCPKQHKVSCPRSRQRQNSLETEPEAPVSVSIWNKPDVCRANLQGSFSSNHETDFKKNESPARKILLKLAWYYSGKSYLGKGFIFLSALSCSFHACKQQSGTLGYFTPYYWMGTAKSITGSKKHIANSKKNTITLILVQFQFPLKFHQSWCTFYAELH